jgi:hypothetical protein
MGKRELLLIAGFVLMGVVVYSLTAPDTGDPGGGFSVSRLLEGARREVSGNRGSAEVVTSTTTAIKPAVKLLRVEARTVSLTVVGEDRDDVATDLKVWSNGYDHAEAEKYAKETTLKLTEAGDMLLVDIDYPEPAQQRSTLVIRVPSRLGVRVAYSNGKLDVSRVDAVEVVEYRGEVKIANVAGRVAVTHRGGALTINAAETVKLNTRGSIVALENVSGGVTLLAQSGEVRGTGLHGPLDVESTGAKIVFDALDATAATIRVNASRGSVRLAGVRSELRLDARDAHVAVSIDVPAPISIATEGEDLTEIVLPRAGYTLDAVAMGGELTMPEGPLEVTGGHDEQRVSGPVNGGGPTITLRTSRGPLVIKQKAPTS